MNSHRNSKVSDHDNLAQLWIKPDQFSRLQDAAYNSSTHVHLQDRDHTLVTFLYDSGARINEASSFDCSMVRLDDGEYYFPSHVQKQYPTGGTPSPARISIDPESTTGAVASLRRYLNRRDDDHDALFTT